MTLTEVALVEVRSRLARVIETIEPWEDVEEDLTRTIGAEQVYLGGDGLRPYLLWEEGGRIHGYFRRYAGELTVPPFLDELMSGRYGIPIVHGEGDGWEHAEWPTTADLARRLQVPTVLIIGLGDAERYRGARLALGIARLGQWLRYTHAARVHVCDYNLLEEPAGTVRRLMREHRPELVGISVNFGQWHQLDEVAQVVNAHDVRALVLGNILAAYDPERASMPFTATVEGKVLVATSLGEKPLETLCARLAQPETWDGIAGLVRPTAQGPRIPALGAPSRVSPPDLVFPDDGLVQAIVARNGQVSFETSFGCNFGACTFCPRDHRGDGWSRGHLATVEAALARVARAGAVVSIVDEEFFGFEGLQDPSPPGFPAQRILEACNEYGVNYEIYTRLEQVFDRRRSREWNLARAALLTRETGRMRRIFVGVESGSGSQLRRYGKGQTVNQIVDSLRVGTALGVPMEFGFITFDPLLTAEELADNVAFLGRRDITKKAVSGAIEDRVRAVERYFDGTDEMDASGVPLFQHVAYMATELEVLAHSRYADMLRRRHPHLLTGYYDPSFARFEVRYKDAGIGNVAGWCRVWTEGMFPPVYESRMEARSSSDESAVSGAKALVERYREATFALLVEASWTLVPDTRTALKHLVRPEPSPSPPSMFRLAELAQSVLGPDSPVTFDESLLRHRRSR